MLAELSTRLQASLAGSRSPAEQLQAALQIVVEAFAASTGTLHRADLRQRTLILVAVRGVPDSMRPAIQLIPFGKGMAGICADQRVPITVCNLQTDDGGVARPGARLSEVAGAIVVPLQSPDDGVLLGTLGIGKKEPYDYSPEEQAALRDCARLLAPLLTTERI